MQSLLQESQSLFTPDMKAGDITNTIAWVITQKKAELLADIRVLARHKSVAVRRKAVEAFRVLGSASDVAFLEQWKTKEGDRKSYVAIESAIDAITRRQSGDQSDFEAHVLTVQEALVQIKHVLGEKSYSIEAEISESKNYYQMYYFTIKDPQSEATLNCRCFQTVIFRSGFPLNEGLQVRITGKFVLDKYSRLLFDVKNIQLTGEGELLRNLTLLQEKLDQEGLLDESRKRKPSALPQRILLLASSSSAAITDFTKVLGRRRGGIDIYHLPIKTQGVGAEAEILDRLRQSSSIVQEYDIDTVVITRGGGSKEDLVVFNSEAVVRAIHGVSRPVIVAIGHERDITLSELVADVRAATPSQAAELASLSRSEVTDQKDRLVFSIYDYFSQKLHSYRVYTERVVVIIRELLRNTILDIRHQLQNVNKSVYAFIQVSRYQARDIAAFCVKILEMRVVESRAELTTFKNLYALQHNTLNAVRTQSISLVQHIIASLELRYRAISQEFAVVVTTIEAIHPKNILKQGYVIVDQGGESLARKTMVNHDIPLQLSFYDGVLEVNTK